MEKIKPETLKKLKRIVRTIGQQYLDLPNVTSVGIGEKIKDDKPTGRISIQFTVDKKITDKKQLERLNIIPIPETLPFAGEEWETDIIERSYQPADRLTTEHLALRQKRRSFQDPLMPGISISHFLESAGTLGCIVFDKKTGEPCALSNWHVLHGSHGQIGDTIVQPGPYDDNSDLDVNRCGKLLRSHLGVAGDCAICSIENRSYSREIIELDVFPEEFKEVELGDRVMKSGRTTGVTHGIVRRIYVTTKIDYGGDVGVTKVGGFEIGVDTECPAEQNEISMGGDSGSIWLLKDKKGKVTQTIAGLHFAGEGGYNPDEHAVACYFHNVLNKLEITLNPEEARKYPPPESYRKGYNADFLKKYKIPHPELREPASRDAFKLNGSFIIDYTHYSLVMNKKRRTAFYTAHNVDGKRMVRLSRRDNWRFDPRIDETFQMGNDIYKNNPWDRGHLVRRVDVQWGTVAEAKRAQDETYFYTNASPQHANFNGDEWLHLEDWVLEKTNEDYYRLCVFTGPVFTEGDQKYRGIRIPPAFWKIITMRRAIDDELSVTAYLMNQYEMLEDKRGSKFLDLKLYQVSVDTIEDLTDLDFSFHKKYEPEAVKEMLVVPEGVAPEPWSIISSPGDIQV
jgi:endonuclease G